MNIPCPQKIDCGPGGPSVNGFDWPVTNYSSEDPDRPIFIAQNWGWDYTHIPPLCGNCPPRDCMVIATNFFSTEEAGRCAEVAQAFCANGQAITAQVDVPCEIITTRVDPTNGGDPGNNKKLYYNGPESCTVFCPDGTPFTSTIPAGRFVADSQEIVDRMAMSEACRLANLSKNCQPGGAACPWMLCPDEFFERSVATGTGTGITYTISEGSLPPGLTLSADGIISGTPGKNFGEYTAVCRKSSAANPDQFIEFPIWIRIFGFNESATLKAGRIGFAYSYQVKFAGQIPGNTPRIEPVHAGGIGVPGLGVSLTGLISGTPTTAGTYDVALQISDGCGGVCQESFQLTIYAVANEEITRVVCPTNPLLFVELTTPIEVGRFNGPAGTAQFQVDSFAKNEAYLEAQALLAAAGCGCYFTSITNPALNEEFVTASCNIPTSAYNFSGGVFSPLGVNLTFGVGATNMHTWFAGSFLHAQTINVCFFRAGSPLTWDNVLVTYYHKSH